MLSGSRFDPDLAPTLRLELAKSNSKPKVTETDIATARVANLRRTPQLHRMHLRAAERGWCLVGMRAAAHGRRRVRR
jgi:hypothetical protein